MGRIRYRVAASLDGYIAGPSGEADWIVPDPDVDFGALWKQFDTFLMGRRTFEAVRSQPGGMQTLAGKRTVIVSSTLAQRDYPDVTVVSDDVGPRVSELREGSGKDIWLFGGGQLFRSMLDLGLVDTVEVAVIPVLLGGGIPLLLPSARSVKLKLTEHRVYPKSGTVSLVYEVLRG